MLTLLRFLAFVVFALGIGSLVHYIITAVIHKDNMEEWRGRKDKYSNYEEHEPEKPWSFELSVSIIVLALGIIAIVVISGSAVVNPTEIGVVENTWTGDLYELQPGTHIWPFSKQLIPLITRVSVYDLRQQRIEIGEPPEGATPTADQSLTQMHGVPSASNSPGQPVVFIWARGWARPNPNKILALHRDYGDNYLDAWVESQWVTTIKNVQGKQSYDFLQESRGLMQTMVEEELQKELLDQDGEPIVIVSQLAIPNYDYESWLNERLTNVADKEMQRQEAEWQISVNQKQQEADKIQADTDYIVRMRAAEAERDSQIARGEGEAEYKRQLADAEAYETQVTYEAEAEGIRQIVLALRDSDEYSEYLRAQNWDGKLPIWWMPGQEGHSPIPILETGDQIQPVP